jgi:hypothetical protein
MYGLGFPEVEPCRVALLLTGKIEKGDNTRYSTAVSTYAFTKNDESRYG